MKKNQPSKRLLVACIAIVTVIISACSKPSDTPTPTPKTPLQLIIGTFGGASVNVSNTNNGSDWKANSTNPETITFTADGKYVATAGSGSNNGTWVLSSDGKTLNLAPGGDVFAISTLDEHNLKLVEDLGSPSLKGSDNVYYRYWQKTYTR